MSTLRETAESILEERVQTFDANYGTNTSIPELETVEGRQHAVKNQEYRLIIGSEGFKNPDGRLGNWTDENLAYFFDERLKFLYQDAAYQKAQEIKAKLLDMYPNPEMRKQPEIDISGGLIFDDQESLGTFNKKDHFISLDNSLMKEIDPKNLEILGDCIEPILMHETTHALWYTTKPHYKQLIDEEVVGKTDDYKNDEKRAPEEAITVYEQIKNYKNQIKRSQHQKSFEAFKNPWKIPEINISFSGYYSDDPYILGAMGASSLEEVMKENENEHEAEEKTRMRLLETSHPQYLNDYIDRFFETKNIPNYPKLFQENLSWLGDIEQADRQRVYIRKLNEINERNTKSSGEDLPLFLEHRALIDAFTALQSTE